MRVSDPSLSRQLFEIENDLRWQPHVSLERLLNIEAAGTDLRRDEVARIKLLTVQALIHVERFEQARELLLDSRRFINSKTDQELAALFESLLARLKYEACDPQSAFTLIERASATLSEEPVDPQVARTLHESLILAANCAVDLGEYSRVIDYLVEAVSLVQRFGFDKGYLLPLHSLGRMYLHLHQFEEAKQCAIAARRLHVNDTRFGYSDYLLASSQLSTGETADCLDSCSSSFMEPVTPSLAVKARILVAQAFMDMGEHEIAQTHISDAFENAQKLQLSREIVKARLCEAILHRSAGHAEKGLASLNSIEDEPAYRNIRRLQHKVLIEKATALQGLQRDTEAAQTYKQVIDLKFEASLLAAQSRLIHEHDLNTLHGSLGVPPIFRSELARPAFISESKSFHAQVLDRLTSRLSSLGDLPSGQLTKELHSITQQLQVLIHNSVDEDRIIERSFKANLLKINPTFTSSELKVCALIWKDKSTAQISYELGTSVRTIDTHRSRIRKKLGLANSDNLRSFLLRL